MENSFNVADSCLDVKQTAQRLKIRSTSTIHKLIQDKKFPNAFKSNNKWWIPIEDIETYEKAKNDKSFLSAKEAAERLGYKSLDSLFNNIDDFPNAFKFDGKWRIPLDDLSLYEKKLQCLTVKQVAIEVGNTSAAYITDMIHKNHFPNAFKLKGKWRIPPKDLEPFKDFIRPEGYLTTRETAEELGYTGIFRLIQEKKLPNAIKVNNVWWVPQGDIKTFKASKNIGTKENFMSLTEAAKELGYKSRGNIMYYLKKNKFPNAFIIKGHWKIPINDIEAFRTDDKYFSDKYYSIKEVAKRLGYNSNTSVLNLLKKEKRFPNALMVNNKWRIPIEDIKKYELSLKPNDCLNMEDTKKEIGCKTSSYVVSLIKQNKLPNAFKIHRKWWIPRSDIEAFKKSPGPFDCFNVKESAKKLGFKTNSSVLLAIKKKKLPNAFKTSGKWWIPSKDISSYLDNKKKNVPIRKERYTPRKAEKKNCLDISQTLEELGYKTKSKIRRMIEEKHLPNAFKTSGKWWIPSKNIENYKNSLKVPSGYLSTKEANIRLKYCNPGAITLLITKKKFPNALKINGRWHIPLKDIEDFEQQKKKSKMKIAYSGEVGFQELKDFIESQNTIFVETKQLFLDYCLIQTNNISGSPAYIKDRINLFKRFYQQIILEIKKELYLLTPEEINSFLDTNSPLVQEQKKIFIRFLKYTHSIKDITPDEEIVLLKERKEKTDSKDIYAPSLFHKLYKYVRKIEIHTAMAVKDRYYANMWAYVTLLLTDFIRGQDLILNTPNIHLQGLNIKNINWFKTNTLSDLQSQSIINQLYIHFKNKRSSKTKSFLTFVVAPDLVHALATSLIISELHRKDESADSLLGTFFQGSYNSIRTEGKDRHKKFFNQLTGEENFQFGSQKLNRSVATYLFYSITEDDKYDSELSLHLTQTARSHTKAETTAIYIQTTNKDGSINRVSHNLFRRGHFGWLYNYIILYVSQYNAINHDLEERTKLIESARQEVAPFSLENLAKFIESYQHLVPLNNKSTSMKSYLRDIYQKRRSVISQLLNYSHNDIKDILINLAKGDFPSKSEHAQCLIYPNCKYPKLASCHSCEYVIPQNLLLIQLKEELDRLIKNIDSQSNPLLIKKDTKFLLHALLIWKEARLAFGDEMVSSFIQINETWTKIENLAHKLPIE
ncbi:helix-turn-helix domain-containing protein [Priestia sp. GS2]|uniref:helix-turn-helix domain-containing protein n=1 Tax=Priestia sp. GS2 TaxID=3117403 RepID=UPI002ED8DC7A